MSAAASRAATSTGMVGLQQSERAKHTANALAEIRSRKQKPSLDFSLHVQDDGSQVSTRERVVKDVQAPAFTKPTDEQFWSKEDPSKPDIAFLKNHFYREGRLTEEQVRGFSLSSASCVHARSARTALAHSPSP